MSKPRRKLTPFLCQEMLYDYATDRLDNERRLAVSEYLKTDKECREILDGIMKAITYVESLASVEPSSEVKAHLAQSENIVSLGRKYSSWREWPDVMRWAIVCLLLVISIAGVISAVPWKKLSLISQRKKSDTIEIATLNGPNPSQPLANSETTEAEAAAGAEASGDDESENAVAADNAGEEDSSDVGEVAQAAPLPPPPASVKTKPTPFSEPTPNSSSPAVTEIVPVSSPTGPKDPKIKGFVYRAFMNLRNLDELGPKITSEIEQLGGERAGEVELGWKRGSGRYYHFALPEVNEEKLLERLRAYGPVRISKDPHPRVMPKGQVRFILWVETSN